MKRLSSSPRSSRYSGPYRPGILVLVASLLVTGCATNGDASVLRALPPAQYTLMVDWPTGPDAAVALRFGDTERSVSAAEFGGMLAEELRALDASSRVVIRSAPGDVEPDLTVTFAPDAAIELSHVGTTNFVAAGGLWLVTWIGGLLVDDSIYKVGMQATCRFALDAQVGVDRTITGAEASLSFFERNDLISWPGLQSLILPPFWTSDERDTACEALGRETVRIVARQIARELKTDFEERSRADLRCSVVLQNPAHNGVPVTATSMPIKLLIEAASVEPVSRVEASVNGQAAVPLTIVAAGASAVEATGMLAGFDVARENWVRIVVTADDNYTRTLRFGAKQ